jgi:hypothetical protein
MLDLFFNCYFLQCTGGLFSSVGAFLPELTFSPLLVLSSFSLGLAWINRWSKKPIMDDTRMIRLDHESPPPLIPPTPVPPPPPSAYNRAFLNFWDQRHRDLATQVAGRSNGNASETKANESFANGLFFDIEAKRTPSIVSKLFSKRSEHIR